MKKVKIRFAAVAVALAVVTTAAMPDARADEAAAVFEEQFDSVGAFNRWKVINGDPTSTTTWTYYASKGNGYARVLKDLSSERKPQDDWLISPSITLEAGKMYELSFYAYAGVSNKTEKMKVTLGTDTTIAAQTCELVDLGSFKRGDETHRTAKFNVASSGTYNIGFYAYSDANQGRIEVDSIFVREVSAGAAPMPIADLAATAGGRGALTAALTFTAPAKAADGTALSSITSIKIYRGDELVGTIDNPQPGAAQTWIDKNAAHGENTYTVTSVNDDGESEPAKVTVYVGGDVPTAVTSLTAKRNKDLSITISWAAPTTSVNGGYFDPENVKYEIRLDGDSITTVDETAYLYAIDAESAQKVYAFTVVPTVDFGAGEEATSNNVISGKPLKTLYGESFANAAYEVSPWAQDSFAADFAWSVLSTPPRGIDSDYDGNSGLLSAKAYYANNNEQSRVMSPLFDLSEMSNPVFSFYLYQWAGNDSDIYGEHNDVLKVQVSVDGGEWRDINEATFKNNASKSGWVKCEVPLTRYEGSNVSFGLLAQLADNADKDHDYVYVDSVAISEAGFTHDLAARSFTVDRKRVSPGEDTHFSLEVYNRGAETVSDYEVVLYKDKVEFQTLDGRAVAATDVVSYSFTAPASLNDTKTTHEWYAEVRYAADEISDNNVTDTIAWTVRTPDVPAPEGLKLSAETDGMQLTWTACESVEAVENSETVMVTDDFESYTPFIIDGIGDWTVVDRDGGATLASGVIPVDYEHKGEAMAWQVFNTTESGVVTGDHYDNVFVSRSGVQYLMCPSNDDYYQANDDWLISPLLDGRAQTVTFYARTPNSASGADWLCVYYSTTDKHPDSFIQVGDDDHIAVWDYWNKNAYTIALPVGAKYFAIRCVKCYLYCMIDDVTYNAANGSVEGRELLGYNIYRNGEKLNDDVVSEASYTDTTTEEGEEYTYTVTAVYDKGESDYSNEVSLTYSGVSAIDAADAVPVAYYSVDGRRLTEPAVGVNIVRMSDGTSKKIIVDKQVR